MKKILIFFAIIFTLSISGCYMDDNGNENFSDINIRSNELNIIKSQLDLPMIVSVVDKITAYKSTKESQVTGDYDRQKNKPTLSRTAERANVMGTDLGASFVHNKRVYFLFGDTVFKKNESNNELKGPDSFAYTFLENIYEEELDITFEKVDPLSSEFKDIEIVNGNVKHNGFCTPTGGFDYKGTMYIFYATDYKRLLPNYLDSVQVTQTVTRSVLARWMKNDPNQKNDSRFDYICDFSVLDSKFGTYPHYKPAFLNVSPVKVNSSQVRGLPEKGEGLLLFATGFYRSSPVYLAYMSMNDLEKRSADTVLSGRFNPEKVYYYAGTDSANNPIWGVDWENHSNKAEPLFAMENEMGVKKNNDIGELSVVLDENTQMFYMTYHTFAESNIDSAVHFRYASCAEPWNFSDPQVLFKSSDARGEFIHNPLQNVYDGLSDSGKRNLVRPGSIYAPYLIAPKFQFVGTDKSRESIYYLLSTWNPYQVVLMKTELDISWTLKVIK